MTAAELARALEVSERTVARDVLALSEAGVPVYADRGRGGGYRLVGGYRTRLTGLGRTEAEALFLSGVPAALREMGLADAASAARLKLSAALLPELRDAGESAAQRFHLDAPTWWQPAETPPTLAPLATAVWEDRPVTARYRRHGTEVERRLEPYGLVLKAGVWYVVARVVRRRPTHRVYRVDRFTAVHPRDARFTRDPDFDLACFWEEHAAAFARSLLRESVSLRLTEDGVRRLRYATDRAAADEAVARGERDGEGRLTVELRVESLDVAYDQLLALGPEAEVLAPDALRSRFAAAATRAAALYAGGRP